MYYSLTGLISAAFVIIPHVYVNGQTCYYPDGSPSIENDQPCSSDIPSNGVMCCPYQWECLSNGLCQNPALSPPYIGRYTCTDKNWGSGCFSLCITNNDSGGGNQAILQCSNGEYCCDGNRPDADNPPKPGCCDTQDTFFSLPEGVVIASITNQSPIPAPATTIAVASTATAPAHTSSAAAPPPTTTAAPPTSIAAASTTKAAAPTTTAAPPKTTTAPAPAPTSTAAAPTTTIAPIPTLPTEPVDTTTSSTPVKAITTILSVAKTSTTNVASAQGTSTMTDVGKVSTIITAPAQSTSTMISVAKTVSLTYLASSISGALASTGTATIAVATSTATSTSTQADSSSLTKKLLPVYIIVPIIFILAVAIIIWRCCRDAGRGYSASSSPGIGPYPQDYSSVPMGEKPDDTATYGPRVPYRGDPSRRDVPGYSDV